MLRGYINHPVLYKLLLSIGLVALAAQCQAALAQANFPVADDGQRIAQANPQVPSPGVIPTDITPIGVNQEQELFEPGLKFRLFKKLPDRLWFTGVTEVSQRLDTNVFFTKNHYLADYAFRVLPNITLGYNVLNRTSVYCNWFLIKDVYARFGNVLNPPTTQSLSLGFRQDIPMGRKTNLQLDFQARELWQATHLRQADLIPNINVTRVFTPNVVGFGSALLQMRGKNYFVAPTREIDPFFTLGFLYRRGQWTFTAVDTYVVNFRHPPFNDSIPRQSNMTMIADIELARTVSKKMPSLQAFMRIEPVWNWWSNGVPGLSGFDYRMYGGLRFTANKPALNASIEQLRQQLLESEGDSKNTNSGS